MTKVASDKCSVKESISMLTHVVASYRKTPVLESFFNSEYCEIFQSTYFEEHLQSAASENVFIKRDLTLH